MNEPIAIEGNGTRPSHRGIGVSDSGTMYTLNATEVHGVVYSERNYAEYSEGVGTLRASGATLGHDGENIALQGGAPKAFDVRHMEEGDTAQTLLAKPNGGWSLYNASVVHAAAVDVRGGAEGETCQTIQAGGHGYSVNYQGAVREGSVIRRLTPVECERLQGFPDGWTRIPWKGRPAPECPDSPRYKALGNSMAVPVMRFIGERIQLLEDELRKYRRNGNE